ncbi:uroporphyrinogen-III C-methyltransferase [Thermoplasma sp.]|uniref:uroporphyrinogen-III C-methyltransferase n=1 Tax=Thermoplasma sp. TaxID=1973142 RepID=UPI0025CD8E45|nr:uroporphyrinogen-III C-methyltransferase [Thermoplasma sp.]
MPEGHVYLIGAGPGDPDLLTVKAMKALSISDIVMYDRLVSNDILNLLRNKELIPVGKEHGKNPEIAQNEINWMMLDYALRGYTVARLKCGDPMIFGRGGEEAAFLVSHGISVEIVPGLTSAISLAEMVGVPLTHRGISSSLTIISGHRAGNNDYDWRSIVNLGGTLVILMSADTIGRVSNSLIDAGMPGDMPVCMVINGSTPMQRVLFCRLSECEMVQRELNGPTTIIIGKVVDMAEKVQNITNPGEVYGIHSTDAQYR